MSQLATGKSLSNLSASSEYLTWALLLAQTRARKERSSILAVSAPSHQFFLGHLWYDGPSRQLNAAMASELNWWYPLIIMSNGDSIITGGVSWELGWTFWFVGFRSYKALFLCDFPASHGTNRQRLHQRGKVHHQIDESDVDGSWELSFFSVLPSCGNLINLFKRIEK